MMKAEEKQELESTVLGTQLERAYEGLRQGPSRATLIYLFGFIVVLGLGFLARYLWHSSQENDSRRWLVLDSAVFPSQLDAVTENKELQGSTQARLARLQEARVKLNEGLQNLGWDKDAPQKVKEGTELFEQLVNESRLLSPPLLRQEVLWSAAKGNEALNNLDRARELYERLVREYPDKALGKDAKLQLGRIKSDAETLREIGERYAPKSN